MKRLLDSLDPFTNIILGISWNPCPCSTGGSYLGSAAVSLYSGRSSCTTWKCPRRWYQHKPVCYIFNPRLIHLDHIQPIEGFTILEINLGEPFYCVVVARCQMQLDPILHVFHGFAKY